MLLEYSWDIEDCNAAGTKQGAVGVARRGAGWLLDTGRGLVAVDTRARTSSTLVDGLQPAAGRQQDTLAVEPSCGHQVSVVRDAMVATWDLRQPGRQLATCSFPDPVATAGWSRGGRHYAATTRRPHSGDTVHISSRREGEGVAGLPGQGAVTRQCKAIDGSPWSAWHEDLLFSHSEKGRLVVANVARYR